MNFIQLHRPRGLEGSRKHAMFSVDKRVVSGRVSEGRMPELLCVSYILEEAHKTFTPNEVQVENRKYALVRYL